MKPAAWVLGMERAKARKSEKLHACNCIGPQNGQPLCPCAMRSVTIEDGRYVRKQDLGPAPKGEGTIGNPQDLDLLIPRHGTLL